MNFGKEIQTAFEKLQTPFDPPLPPLPPSFWKTMLHVFSGGTKICNETPTPSPPLEVFREFIQISTSDHP